MSKNNNSYTAQFEAIVDQYQNRLFRFAYMRIGNREIAEDIVQDVFLSLYRMMSRERKIKDIRSYLLQSINNVCVDHYRKNRPIIVSIDEAEDRPNEADREIYEEFLRIKRLLDTLPDEQAETVRLKCYDDLTFREIAELHNLSEATVKSRYRYAIKHIQEKLKKQ